MKLALNDYGCLVGTIASAKPWSHLLFIHAKPVHSSQRHGLKYLVHQRRMLPSSSRFDQPTKDAIVHFILRSAMKLSPYGKLVVLSALKGVGSNLFEAEDVKPLFSDLLDRRSHYQSGLDSKQKILSTYEIQILCMLLEVLFSVSDRANIGFDKFEALLKALRVDGLSPVGARVFLTYYLEQIGCQQTGATNKW